VRVTRRARGWQILGAQAVGGVCSGEANPNVGGEDGGDDGE